MVNSAKFHQRLEEKMFHERAVDQNTTRANMISELIRNSRLSDRELAKKLGVSQATASRRRAALDKQGLLNYTANPDLKKLGFEILAFTLAKWNSNKERQIEERKEFVNIQRSYSFQQAQA
jgi:DNA-binding Lrp family transcriptional regulator